ncbi:MAG: glycosyltransferase family 39 protein [Anaerolineales bacterium]|nr:glycosyltransferase family 39 protein [Anaerolineales bacterium]
MSLFSGQKNQPAWLICLVIFIVAFVPRALGLDAFIAIDEARWVYRSAFFWRVILAGNFAQASAEAAPLDGGETYASGVPVMWLGGLGLATKYWADSARPVDNLSDYLALVPLKTEKIPLDFYAWTRWPFILLASLFLVSFYLLLSQLLKPGVSLLATLLLVFDPFFMGLSRLVHNDITVCIAINLSLLTLLYYRRHSPMKTLKVLKTFRVWPIGWLLLSGLLAGLALATKPTALYLFVFAAIFLLFEKGWPRHWADWRRAVTEGIMWGIVALLTIIAIWPALWTAPVETLSLTFYHSGSGLESEDNPSLLPYLDDPVPQLGFLFYPVNWIFKSTLPLLIGLIGLLVGIKQGWFKKPPIDEPGGLAGSSTPASGLALPPTWWTVKWLAIFVVLFYLLLAPADTRDLRYASPTFPGLYALAAVGVLALIAKLSAKMTGITRLSTSSLYIWGSALLLAIQIVSAAIYFPYYFNYLNPVVGGRWLAPHLIKVGSGEGLDHMAFYLNQKPNVRDLTAATSLWDTFVPFYEGRYTKAHYKEEADYIIIYLRQIQNRNPFPEFWPYFAARTPEHVVTLAGLDYVWLYPGPQLREVRDINFDNGLILRGYRLERRAAEPGQPAHLTLVWGGATPTTAGQTVMVKLNDEAGRVWAEGRGPVLDPNGPSAVEGHYLLTIPAEIPRGDYQLWVSLENVSAASPGYLAGKVPVRQLVKPPVEFAASANFGNMVNFGGANVALASKAAGAGETFEIQFLWQARQPIPQPYTTFAHLVDETGQIWGQADRTPHLGGSELPTNQWDEDEWIVDTFQISLHPDTPPGRYKLLAGLYNPQTLERLPIVGGDEGQNIVEVTSLTLPSPTVLK